MSLIANEFYINTAVQGSAELDLQDLTLTGVDNLNYHFEMDRQLSWDAISRLEYNFNTVDPNAIVSGADETATADQTGSSTTQIARWSAHADGDGKYIDLGGGYTSATGPASGTLPTTDGEALVRAVHNCANFYMMHESNAAVPVVSCDGALSALNAQPTGGVVDEDGDDNMFLDSSINWDQIIPSANRDPLSSARLAERLVDFMGSRGHLTKPANNDGSSPNLELKKANMSASQTELEKFKLNVTYEIEFSIGDDEEGDVDPARDILYHADGMNGSDASTSAGQRKIRFRAVYYEDPQN
jgi:hypothetical protein